jgi:hypothetical protein
MGALSASMGSWMARSRLQRRRWPTAPGEILTRAVARDDRSFSQGSTYVPAVTYRYRTGETERVGNITYAPPGYALGPGPARMQKLVDALPAEIDVRYNPNDPAEAFLRFCPLVIPAAALLLGLFAFLAGVLLLL